MSVPVLVIRDAKILTVSFRLLKQATRVPLEV